MTETIRTGFEKYNQKNPGYLSTYPFDQAKYSQLQRDELQVVTRAGDSIAKFLDRETSERFAKLVSAQLKRFLENPSDPQVQQQVLDAIESGKEQ